jgi:transketolase
MQAERGGYVVLENKDAKVTLIATGSEVSTLVEGAELLAEEGIATRIVSVPSEGLFRDQPKEYQAEVLGNLPRYGMTSGLSLNLRGLVGEDGFIHGFDHFGYSAPFKVLDEKFGYNGKTVAEEVKAML